MKTLYIKKTIYLIQFILCFILYTNTIQFIFAETQLKIDNWQIHTSMLNVQTTAMDSKNRVWIGTTGGLTIYDDKNNDTILINRLNGLLSQNITKISSDIQNKLLILGTNDGVIEIVNEELQFTHITSIRDHNFSNSTINDIVIYNNKAYIAGGWGIAEFDIINKIFTNTIETIGEFQKNTVVNNIILQKDTLWAATASGIAFIPLSKRINIAKEWTCYKYPNDETYIKAQIAKINNNIYVNFETKIYNFKNESFSTFLETDGQNYNNILKIDVYNNELIYSTAYQLFTVNQQEIFSNWTTNANNFSILRNNINEDKENFIISFNYNKLGTTLIRPNLTHKTITTNTPCVNYFMDLAINSDGKIFAVTDNSLNHKTSGGIMAYDGSKWTNYNNLHSDAPFGINEQFNSISISKDNKVYAGGWGLGLVIIDEKKQNPEQKYTIINENNSPMTPYAKNYRIAGQTAFDTYNNIWTVIYGEKTAGSILMSFDTNYSNYRVFNNLISSQNRMYYNIAIDNYNTKWLIGALNTVGIIYLNDKNTKDTYDDIWGVINTSNYPNLLNNDANCIAIDNVNSRIWLGTSNGISIILNPYAITTNSNLIISSFSFLKGQTINDILFDAIGNKWIATNSGVFILNAIDDTLGSITTKNSPLQTNEVNSLIMNPKNGLIYLGTKNGLYIAQTSIIIPNNNYDLKTYPNPFNIEKDINLTIDGLVSGTELRIITPDGKRIKTIFTDSQRAIWNGKDDKGNKVQPGVYIIIGSSVLTNSSAACKIAIIK